MTSYLSHPEILNRKLIRSSKNLRIHPEFRSEELQETLYFDPEKNYVKKEVIQRNDLEPPTLDPEQDFIDPKKKCLSSG